MKKTLIIFFLLLIPCLSFSQEIVSFNKIKDESEERVEQGRGLISFLKDIWNKDIVPFFKKTWNSIVNFWQNSFKSLFQKEVEKRKPVIKEDFEKEKQELREEAPELGKSLWERLKGIISE
jgi:hypothetical protein